MKYVIKSFFIKESYFIFYYNIKYCKIKRCIFSQALSLQEEFLLQHWVKFYLQMLMQLFKSSVE